MTSRSGHPSWHPPKRPARSRPSESRARAPPRRTAQPLVGCRLLQPTLEMPCLQTACPALSLHARTHVCTLACASIPCTNEPGPFGCVQRSRRAGHQHGGQQAAAEAGAAAAAPAAGRGAHAAPDAHGHHGGAHGATSAGGRRRPAGPAGPGRDRRSHPSTPGAQGMPGWAGKAALLAAWGGVRCALPTLSRRDRHLPRPALPPALLLAVQRAPMAVCTIPGGRGGAASAGPQLPHPAKRAPWAPTPPADLPGQRAHLLVLDAHGHHAGLHRSGAAGLCRWLKEVQEPHAHGGCGQLLRGPGGRLPARWQAPLSVVQASTAAPGRAAAWRTVCWHRACSGRAAESWMRR